MWEDLKREICLISLFAVTIGIHGATALCPSVFYFTRNTHIFFNVLAFVEWDLYVLVVDKICLCLGKPVCV